MPRHSQKVDTVTGEVFSTYSSVTYPLSRSFRLRRDAEAYDAKMRTERQRGDWIDPRRGRVTLADVWADYQRVGMGHPRDTTKAAYRNAWRHVDATFGRWPVAKIVHADVADRVTSLSSRSGPDLVRYAHRVLCLMLDHAMRSRRVPVNVARGIRLPHRPPARDRVPDGRAGPVAGRSPRR